MLLHATNDRVVLDGLAVLGVVCVALGDELTQRRCEGVQRLCAVFESSLDSLPIVQVLLLVESF